MTKSVIIAEQVRTYGPRPIADFGPDATIIATVRFDDRCGNGHKTFAITADVTSRRGARRVAPCMSILQLPSPSWNRSSSGTCARPLVPCTTSRTRCTGSAGAATPGGITSVAGDPRATHPPNFEHAKRSAIWPDMPTSYLITDTVVSNAEIEAVLAERLPALLASFRAAIESWLGLSW